MSDESGFQMGDDTIPDRYDLHIRRFMKSHVHALIHAAAISPDDATLDVACGTGLVARTAVDRGHSGCRHEHLLAMLATATVTDGTMSEGTTVSTTRNR